MPLGEVDVKFRLSATIPRLYRIKFKRDIFKDLSKLEKTFKANDGSFEIDDLEISENVVYIISAYERIGDTVKAKLVSLATDVSYAKGAAIVTGGEISRQTVKNQIRKLGPLEKEREGEKKREVPELHIYADEDHVSMQKPKKEKGKKNKQLPLVTVTEGTECNGTNRNRTIGKMHFVDINAKEVWKSVEGYLYKTYNLEKMDDIYIHGDGAKWIRNGLLDMANTYHVLDGYHLKKRLRDIAKKFPKKNLKKRFHSVIMKNDKKKPEVTYRMYAEKVLEEAVKGAYDWSIIEGTPKIMNISSPTQIAIHGIGSLKNTLWS